VTFGPTRVSAVCSGEIVAPKPERPNEGRISFHVEYGPIASPSFDGRPSVQATTVANLIERLIKGSRAVDAEALCIVGGKKVWSIRVDVRALDDDGNLADACVLAALCSLLHFRKSDIEVKGQSANIYSGEERVPVPLSVHHLPVPVTFALFSPCEGGGREANEAVWILDPNRLEETAMDGALCIAVNQHGELCGLHKPGGLPIGFSMIEHCTQVAISRARELTERIQAELKADAAKRHDARRNVHQHFTQSQLLTVDGVSKSQTASLERAGAAKPEVALHKVQLQKWKRRAQSQQSATIANAPLEGASPASQTAPAVLEDDGRDLDAELEAVAAEAAELEAQLVVAESEELAAAAATAAQAQAVPQAALPEGVARPGRKKRRST